MIADVDRQMRTAMRLSLVIGFVLLVVKCAAWMLTRSSAVLSDAAESVVHVFAVGFAVWSFGVSRRPADGDHPYGHAKIAFISAGFEGGVIGLAGLFIIVDAVRHAILGPQVQNIDKGLLLVLLALIINGALGYYLLWLGRREHALILEANGKHVLTDAWTSVGVLLSLLVTRWTGWLMLDPIVGVGIGIQILVSGAGLVRRAARGLMDHADPAVTGRVSRILDEETHDLGISYHALRHRNTGDGQWIDMHLVFDDATSIRDAHRIATRIEHSLRDELGAGTKVTSHLEPKVDHDSAHEQGLRKVEAPHLRKDVESSGPDLETGNR